VIPSGTKQFTSDGGTMKYFAGLLVSLGILFVVSTQSSPSSDEETLKNLELGWSKCANYTQKDADCFKRVIGPRLVVIQPNGMKQELTKDNIDEEYKKIYAANPKGKSVYEFSDIVAKVYGDVGIVTYDQKAVMKDYSDQKMNNDWEMSVVDTWQKIGGEWKVLVTANVSKRFVPSDKY
jgi:hypothetical protein